MLTSLNVTKVKYNSSAAIHQTLNTVTAISTKLGMGGYSALVNCEVLTANNRSMKTE